MIKAENLNVSFKTENGLLAAVKNVSFDLQRGKVLGIVGESGSGKSVTALSLLRLHDKKNATIGGKVFFDETDLLQLNEKEMSAFRGNKISMIFQEPMTSLNPVLTCGLQVAESIKLHLKKSTSEAKQLTINLFSEVQLPRPEIIYSSYPHELSGGQKQRVMIAMALACDPQILIADEPTTALDVTVQNTIIQLLLKLKDERNMSMIFISHDLGVISSIADKVLVMYKGEIVEEASTDEIFQNPRHPYTRGLIACRPPLDIKVKKLPVIADFMDAGTTVNLADSKKSVQDIINQFIIPKSEIWQRRDELQSKPPLLSVQNLKTWYPVNNGLFKAPTQFIKAVDEVSFDIFPGETLGLAGESGCGKTTLGRSIVRLIEPTAGKVIFNEQDIIGLNKEELRKFRRSIQIIFQDPYSSLNPRLTIGQSILEPMEVHRIHANYRHRKEKVIDLLEKVNLNADHFNRYPHEFSGGQRQRVSIARALGLEPKFIIFDESVSALDVSVQAQVLNLLTDLQREFKLTYLFISHDLAVIKHIADRMIIMNGGKIVESGYPDEIFLNPKQAYTRKLIDAIPKINVRFS